MAEHQLALAESSLAGCLLVDTSAALRDCRGIVSASDFVNEAARAIYSASLALDAAGKIADPVQIQAEAARQGFPLDDRYCADLMRLYTTTANIGETARIIHEDAQRRRAHEIGLALANDDLSTTDALAKLQELMQAQGSTIQTPLEAANSVMDYISAAAEGHTKPFLSTGFPSLDTQLSGGLVAGGLITLAARPGTGKTTAALAIAENVAVYGGKVLYISLEMTTAQLWACRVASASGLSRSNIYAGRIRDDGKEWQRLTDAFDLLSRRPFYIRDVPSTLEDIEREARCMDGLSLLVVDHIGLVKPTERGSRYEIMTQTAHRLKQLALSLKIPVLALCQLNRQSEARESKRPTMADLRDSGAVEEDSDVVCLLFRPSQYSPEDQRPKAWESQALDFIIDKNSYIGDHETWQRQTLSTQISRVRKAQAPADPDAAQPISV